MDKNRMVWFLQRCGGDIYKPRGGGIPLPRACVRGSFQTPPKRLAGGFTNGAVKGAYPMPAACFAIQALCCVSGLCVGWKSPPCNQSCLQPVVELNASARAHEKDNRPTGADAGAETYMLGHYCASIAGRRHLMTRLRYNKQQGCLWVPFLLTKENMFQTCSVCVCVCV